jgi:uroporphyrinogen-III decarboxylase
MENEKTWAALSWKEKREERFKRWLSPPDVKFVSFEAEKLYQARVTRFIKAIKMEEPDRVPVMLPVGNYPAYYAGADYYTIMNDYQVAQRAWIKFMDDFGDMDTFSGPALVPSGKITEALGSRVSMFPGYGLPTTATMNQTVEAEYMNENEYDQFLQDTSDYSLRVMLPRTTRLFESFKKLPPLRMLQGAAWVSALADPEIRQTFQTLMDLSGEYRQWQTALEEINRIIVSRGYPSFRNSGLMAGAPFDHFADLLRGTRGISMDLRRQPQKLHAAMERWTNLTINSFKNFPMTNCPVVMMPLHKGDDTFMSEKQFDTFYWPYLKRVFIAMIEEGMVPMPFAEGRYNIRLKQIADTPRSSVIWYFDQTDMAEAKKVLGSVSCIVGNLPTSVVITNTPQEVKEKCRRLIEACAPGGGYILSGGAQVDKANIPNLKAMMESAYEYGIYKK